MIYSFQPHLKGVVFLSKKIRIAQLTLNGYFNYGNILQKFALHRTLKKFADFTEVLCPRKFDFFPETGDAEKLISQYVLLKERVNYEQSFYLREAIRQSKFKDFENLYIQTRFDLPYLEEIADDYDYFVVGSDQVWNPRYCKQYMFLNFVPHEKKISYAASIGEIAIPDDKKETFRCGIADFNYLSVREENAVKLINELTGLTPQILLDPVFLLTPEEWLAVSQKPTWLKEKYQRGYILTYYLGKLPPPGVKAVATKLALPVINLLNTENYNHFTVGPAEFIWLFANASLVLTNSFHGAAFSILFKRPFTVNTLRNEQDPRMVSLFKLFGLEGKTALAELLEMDFSRCDEVLRLERTKAFNFLTEAFGVNPTEKTLGGNAS